MKGFTKDDVKKGINLGWDMAQFMRVYGAKTEDEFLLRFGDVFKNKKQRDDQLAKIRHNSRRTGYFKEYTPSQEVADEDINQLSVVAVDANTKIINVGLESIPMDDLLREKDELSRIVSGLEVEYEAEIAKIRQKSAELEEVSVNICEIRKLLREEQSKFEQILVKINATVDTANGIYEQIKIQKTALDDYKQEIERRENQVFIYVSEDGQVETNLEYSEEDVRYVMSFITSPRANKYFQELTVRKAVTLANLLAAMKVFDNRGDINIQFENEDDLNIFDCVSSMMLSYAEAVG